MEIEGAPARIAARWRGQGFLLPPCNGFFQLAAGGRLLLEESNWLFCSYAVGAGAIPLEIQEVWETEGVRQDFGGGGQAQVTPLCIA